jgi:hypothetical protein
MIGEIYLLKASHYLQVDGSWGLLPQNTVTPGRNPLLLGSIILLASLVKFIGWRESDIALCVVSIELMLKFLTGLML